MIFSQTTSNGDYTLSLEVVESGTSVAANTSTCPWSLKLTANSWSYFEDYSLGYTVYIGGILAAYAARGGSWSIPAYGTITLASGTVEVAHNADGTGSAACSAAMDFASGAYGPGPMSCSGTLQLSTIPRASAITAVGNVTLGNACNVKWTPASAAFRYRLQFVCGSWSYTTGVIHPNTTGAYTYAGYAIPLEVAAQMPSASSGAASATLYTYSDAGGTAQIGSADSKGFTVTVPENGSTRPSVSAALSPAEGPGGFTGYIQQKTKVQAGITASGKYGASIAARWMVISGVTYNASGSTAKSGVLTASGTLQVVCYARDSRGFVSSVSQSITVQAYGNPLVQAISGAAIAARCGADGGRSEDGMYLSVWARREYASVSGQNRCRLQYRYKATGGSFTAWETVLDYEDSGDTVQSGALAGGGLSAASSYTVEVRAADTLGGVNTVSVTIPTERVFLDRNGARNSLTIGGRVDRDNTVDIAEGLDFYVHGRSFLELVYPVGAIYLSTVSTSPATLFGFGTWERIQNRFLLAAGSSYGAGSTGGAASNTHSHPTTVSFDGNSLYVTTSGASAGSRVNTGKFAVFAPAGISQGGTKREDYTYNATISTMPPYLAVYVWKRTA